MAKVRISHLYKIYPGEKGRQVTAVEDLNLDIADREFVVLVGPSGCGKSTTLRMIAGLEEISKGDIYIDDCRVNDVPPKDRDIAMVFQNYALYPHMTVYDNMAFGLKLRRYSKANIHQRVGEAANILDIKELLNRKPKALSGGQRQRVAVGRAIVRQPKVFLFDEPLSNLDAKMRVQMRTELAKLHQRLQATMIYVTHDQMEAMTLGDRIVVMDKGRLQQHDTPLKLYNEPDNLFVAGFVGTPPMNFINGTVTRDRDELMFKERETASIEVRWRVQNTHRADELSGKPMVLGIRPEDIDVAEGRGPNFTATIDMVEPMGPETNLYLKTGAHTLVCRCPRPFEHGTAGAQLQFRLNVAKVHLFDPTTSLRVHLS